MIVYGYGGAHFGRNEHSVLQLAVNYPLKVGKFKKVECTSF